MKTSRFFVPLALLPVALSAQTTVYSTNFSTGVVNPAQPSYATGDWAVLSSRNNTASTISYATNAYSFGMTDGSSAIVETQTRFSDTPVSLSGVGEYIQLNILFTSTNNILSAATNNSSLNVGLYNATGGGNPATTLANLGLVNSGTSGFDTGFVAGWEGYIGRFGHVGASTTSNLLATRPAQSGGPTDTSRPQDLLFAGAVGGSYNSPAAATIASANPAASFSLTNGNQYTLTYRITQTGETSQSFDLNIFDGTDTSATALESISGSLATAIATDFNALAVGYRFSGTSAASLITLNEITVDYFSASVIPEPSSFAALAGLAGLGLAGLRRRRRA